MDVLKYNTIKSTCFDKDNLPVKNCTIHLTGFGDKQTYVEEFISVEVFWGDMPLDKYEISNKILVDFRRWADCREGDAFNDIYDLIYHSNVNPNFIVEFLTAHINNCKTEREANQKWLDESKEKSNKYHVSHIVNDEDYTGDHE